VRDWFPRLPALGRHLRVRQRLGSVEGASGLRWRQGCRSTWG
jgi:hypothetical protein